MVSRTPFSKSYSGTYPSSSITGVISHCQLRCFIILYLSEFRVLLLPERVAMNSPIQGTAADIMKIAMIAVDRELRKRGLSSRIVLQIHDELLIETANNEVEEVKEILTDKMKHAADLRVSLEVDAKIGDSWFDAK